MGKLVQVATTSVTNVSNFSITGIDDDSVYMVTLNDLYMNTDGARPRLRFTVSGTPDTSANYDYANKDMYANTTFSNNAGANQTYYNGFSLGTDNTEGLRAVYYLYNFNNSSEYSFITFEEIATNNAGANAGRMGGMVLTVAQSCDGLNWHSSLNNINNATATLYKVL
jgi:hypothetical protein